MDEQQLRWCINQCSNAIDSLKEDLRKARSDRDELEELMKSLGTLGTRLENSKESGLQKIRRRMGSIFAAIKQQVFEDMRSAVCGPEYSTAVQSVGSAVGAARNKLNETEERIRSIQSEITSKQNQLNSYWYQLNNLDKGDS